MGCYWLIHLNYTFGITTCMGHLSAYYLFLHYISWYLVGIVSRLGCNKRAYSSVSQSAPLIRVRSVVQLHIGPPVNKNLEHWGYSSRCDRRSIQALMERWFDTTHTFQLPCGEYTISPASFSAITGLSCAGERIF